MKNTWDQYNCQFNTLWLTGDETKAEEILKKARKKNWFLQTKDGLLLLRHKLEYIHPHAKKQTSVINTTIENKQNQNKIKKKQNWNIKK